MFDEGKIDVDYDNNIIIINKEGKTIAVGAGKMYPEKYYNFWKSNIGYFCKFRYSKPCNIKGYEDYYHAHVIEFEYQNRKKRKFEDNINLKEDYIEYRTKFKKAIRDNIKSHEKIKELEKKIEELKKENEKIYSEANNQLLDNIIEKSKLETAKNLAEQKVERLYKILDEINGLSKNF